MQTVRTQRNAGPMFNWAKLQLLENDTALEYSEDPEKLKEVLSETTIEVKSQGIRPYFDDDKEEREVLTVKVGRNGKVINFEYGDSIRNAGFMFDIAPALQAETTWDYNRRIIKGRRQVFADRLYSILTCIAMDYHIPCRFDDFCAELGYDNDSIKALDLHRRCEEQSRKLQSIFTEEEIASFPS